MTTKTNKSGEFIYITKNLVSNQTVGSKLIMKTHIAESNTNITNLYDSNKLKNRIILSNKLKQQNSNNKISASLLTQQNLHNNIKFDFRDVSYNNISSRIVFLKYSYVAEISNNNTYLFNNLSNVSINNTTKDISQNLATITPSDISNTQNYVQTLNFYTQKHKNKHERLDYYNFKLQDFLYKHSNSQKFADDLIDSSTNQYEGDICFNDLIYELNFNDLSFTNIDITSINKNDDTFKTIYYKANNQLYNKLESSFNNIDDNLYLFNKKDVISTFTFDLKDNSNTIIDYNTSDLSNNIEFFLINKFDFTDFRNPSFGKISFADKLVTMNCRVLNYNNNFFDKNFSGNNDKIFLALGNGICGLTQKNISENVKLYIANTNDNLENDRIFFTKKSNINFSNAEENYSNYLSDNSKNYLFNQDFKIDYTNFFIIRNTSRLSSRNFNFEISDIVEENIFLQLFLFIETFNNMELVNNKHPDYLFGSSNPSNLFGPTVDLSFSSFNYLTQHLKIKCIDQKPDESPLAINKDIILNYNDTINYDFTGNSGGEAFFSNYNINLLFNNSSAIDDNVDFSDSLINFFDNEDNESDSLFLMNFYKITVQNFMDNDAEANNIGSDDVFREFTGCIFIYHDPDSQNTRSEFKYPNNNIEVSFDENLQLDATTGKIILNDSTSLNSRTNTVYIPKRNSSNYSRKQIFGLIGLGNESIGRLLGIQPYNEDFIIGRGFNNQFQINDTCLTEKDLINRKINSQKYESKKTGLQFTQKQNFANIVKNSRRSRVTNLTNECTTNNNIPNSISEITTPFRFFKTNRGNYLRSGR